MYTHNIKIHNSHVCHCAFDAIVQKRKEESALFGSEAPHALMVTGRAISVWSELIAELVRPMADAIAELWPEDGRPSDGSRKMAAAAYQQRLYIPRLFNVLASSS